LIVLALVLLGNSFVELNQFDLIFLKILNYPII